MDRASFKEFFVTLVRLLSTKRVVLEYMDTPLDRAARRTWTFTLFIALYVTLFASQLPSTARLTESLHQHLPVTASSGIEVLLVLVAWAIAWPVTYAFVRLYTLVAHVLTLNVFKTRGQRLRLLNAETTLLPLGTLYFIGWLLGKLTIPLAEVVCIGTALYHIYLLAFSYNFIFHKSRLQGLVLLIASTLVTWFVLAIGALAVSVTVGVLGLFILLILRLFMH